MRNNSYYEKMRNHAYQAFREELAAFQGPDVLDVDKAKEILQDYKIQEDNHNNIMKNNAPYKIYIDTYGTGTTREIAQFLEILGFRYGCRRGYTCQRRAYSNMPYITVNVRDGLYSGSKGAAINVEWEKLNVSDIGHKIREIRDGLRTTEGVTNHVVSREDYENKRRSELTMWQPKVSESIYISDMSDGHLHNTILFILKSLDEIIPIHRETILKHKLEIMEEERTYREMPVPLIPFKSLKYRRKENV